MGLVVCVSGLVVVVVCVCVCGGGLLVCVGVLSGKLKTKQKKPLQHKALNGIRTKPKLNHMVNLRDIAGEGRKK